MNHVDFFEVESELGSDGFVPCLLNGPEHIFPPCQDIFGLNLLRLERSPSNQLLFRVIQCLFELA